MDEAEEMDVFVQEDEVMTARDLQEQLMQAQHEQRFAVELLERLKSDYDETLVENEEKDNMIRRLEMEVREARNTVMRQEEHSEDVERLLAELDRAKSDKQRVLEEQQFQAEQVQAAWRALEDKQLEVERQIALLTAKHDEIRKEQEYYQQRANEETTTPEVISVVEPNEFNAEAEKVLAQKVEENRRLRDELDELRAQMEMLRATPTVLSAKSNPETPVEAVDLATELLFAQQQENSVRLLQEEEEERKRLELEARVRELEEKERCYAELQRQLDLKEQLLLEQAKSAAAVNVLSGKQKPRRQKPTTPVLAEQVQVELTTSTPTIQSAAASQLDKKQSAILSLTQMFPNISKATIMAVVNRYWDDMDKIMSELLRRTVSQEPLVDTPAHPSSSSKTSSSSAPVAHDEGLSRAEQLRRSLLAKKKQNPELPPGYSPANLPQLFGNEEQGPAAARGYQQQLVAEERFQQLLSHDELFSSRITLPSEQHVFLVRVMDVGDARALGFQQFWDEDCQVKKSHRIVIEWPIALVKSVKADDGVVLVEGWIQQAKRPGMLSFMTIEAFELFELARVYIHRFTAERDAAIARQLQKKEMAIVVDISDAFLSELRLNEEFNKLLAKESKTGFMELQNADNEVYREMLSQMGGKSRRVFDKVLTKRQKSTKVKKPRSPHRGRRAMISPSRALPPGIASPHT